MTSDPPSSVGVRALEIGPSTRRPLLLSAVAVAVAMEQLEDASPEEQARAIEAGWARLQQANDAPVSLRAFAARQLQQRTENEDVRVLQSLLG
jgi:hypothetical protein